MTNPTAPDLAYGHADPADPMHTATIHAARDAKVCACGHLNVSHGYGDQNGPTWPDGSRIGRGACGIDRDRRTHAMGYLGDPCPCAVFEDRAANR